MEINQKDGATEKIIIFVIGALFGAVIATGAFVVSVNMLGSDNSNTQSSSQIQGGGTPPEMPNGQGGQNGQGGTPPDMPGTNSQNSENS